MCSYSKTQHTLNNYCYGLPSWSPYLAKDIDLLEKIQHHATKLVSDISSLPYTKHLSLYSLFLWRQRGDLIRGCRDYQLLACPTLQCVVIPCMLNNARITQRSGHAKRIFVNYSYSRLNLSKNFFINRVVHADEEQASQ